MKRAKQIEDHLLLDKVQGRGDTCIDMIAYELKYHNLCITRFLKPSDRFSTTKNEEKISVTFNNIFEEIIPNLKNKLFINYEILTLSDIRQVVHNKAKEYEIFWNPKYPFRENLCEKIKLHFGDSLVIVRRGEGFSDYVGSLQYIINLIKSKKKTGSPDPNDMLSNFQKSPDRHHSNYYHYTKLLK